MLQLPQQPLPAVNRWFTTGEPGPASVPEHVAAFGVGDWWVDDAVAPRVAAVSCAGHVLLGGDPHSLTPSLLAPFARSRVEAPVRFLPVLGAAFDRLVPVERMVYIHREPVAAPRPPRGVTVRRVEPRDADALTALGDDCAWIHSSWGGPSGLAASGHAWGAFDRAGRVAAVACGYFVGGTYEDVAVLTAPERRREGLALACVTALCADITARGRTASWSCGRDNRPSRLLGWTAGFRLHREYVQYATGDPSVRPPRVPRPASRTAV
ncbi:GNAT family N-acetyltransferase [Streptomyces formicae]